MIIIIYLSIYLYNISIFKSESYFWHCGEGFGIPFRPSCNEILFWIYNYTVNWINTVWKIQIISVSNLVSDQNCVVRIWAHDTSLPCICIYIHIYCTCFGVYARPKMHVTVWRRQMMQISQPVLSKDSVYSNQINVFNLVITISTSAAL